MTLRPPVRHSIRYGVDWLSAAARGDSPGERIGMPDLPRPRRVAYGVALLATAGCLLLRWLLQPVLGDAVPHMTFFPAVMIAAYVG